MLIILVIIFVPIPVMIKYMLAGKNAYRSILEGITTAAVGIMLVFIFSNVFSGISLFTRLDMILSSVSVNDLALTKGYESLGLSELGPEEMQKALDTARELIKISIPGFTIILVTIFSYFNYLWISLALHKMGKTVSLLPPFRTFSLPKNALIGAIIVYVLSFFAGSMGIVDKELIMVNVQMIFGFLFSIQGLSFVFYYGKLRRVPKFVLILISAILVITSIGQLALFMTGLMDIAFDMRKRFSQNLLKNK